MNAKFKAANPDEIKMELTITLSLKDWKIIYEKLTPINSISFSFVDILRSMIFDAQKNFYGDIKIENAKI